MSNRVREGHLVFIVRVLSVLRIATCPVSGIGLVLCQKYKSKLTRKDSMTRMYEEMLLCEGSASFL